MVEKICHLLRMMKKFMRNDDEIWNVVKGLLKLKFTTSPIRNDKYILAKLKIFRKKNITTFNNNNIVPIEKNNYIFIPVIDIDSVLKIDKKVYPQVYPLELLMIVMVMIVIMIVNMLFSYK